MIPSLDTPCRAMITNGLYDQQLAHWMRFYPGNHYCLLSFDFFQSEPAAALELVASFFGLESDMWEFDIGSLKNTSLASEVLPLLTMPHHLTRFRATT